MWCKTVYVSNLKCNHTQNSENDIKNKFEILRILNTWNENVDFPYVSEVSKFPHLLAQFLRAVLCEKHGRIVLEYDNEKAPTCRIKFLQKQIVHGFHYIYISNREPRFTISISFVLSLEVFFLVISWRTSRNLSDYTGNVTKIVI